MTARTADYPWAACRGPIRHRWEHVPHTVAQRPKFGALALFRCETCGSERRDIYSRTTGQLLSRAYRHPEGYKTKRRSAAAWRLIWARQVG